ncbi:DUF59 domain-containing protein [Candidatus Peregrinibacteria bacterium]|jgi:metal-sulfur cluster biosynthetic enzyme|nr:DUF59 domain-containing protein [Candidatus Peregrinibacteria bacterium]MBT7736930.1 DUF59 domain-containing protein [Candidatus Peregrinibacteria bacterium]
MPAKKTKTSKAKKEFPRPKAQRTEPYWKELNKVIDPELNIGLVDLGLIYDIDVRKDGSAVVVMTLTTPSCPVGPQLISDVEDKMLLQKDIKKVCTEIVWDPFWSDEMVDPAIKAMIWGD